MYERLENCPSCNQSKFENALICKDHSVSGESFALVKCNHCQLLFTNPRPVSDQLDKYYESDTYISHTDKANTLINLIYKTVRSYTLRQKRKLLLKYNQPGTILDYGCGTGNFLKQCQQNGFNASGIEPNETARNIAADKTKLPIYTSLEQIKSVHFETITAWHVIEHVSDLTDTISQLKNLLSNTGHLFIAVPNPNSKDSQHYKENWAAYDVPRHLYHFTKSSLHSLANSLGLKIIDIHPMKFDSYYVSLLSEKYGHNEGSFSKALANGYRSNRSASKTGEYSSLIYVLTHKH